MDKSSTVVGGILVSLGVVIGVIATWSNTVAPPMVTTASFTASSTPVVAHAPTAEIRYVPYYVTVDPEPKPTRRPTYTPAPYLSPTPTATSTPPHMTGDTRADA